MSAPAASRRCAILAKPLYAAPISTVFPKKSAVFGSAPCASRTSTASRLPQYPASISAEYPRWSRSSIGQPSSSKCESCTTSLAFAAAHKLRGTARVGLCCVHTAPVRSIAIAFLRGWEINGSGSLKEPLIHDSVCSDRVGLSASRGRRGWTQTQACLHSERASRDEQSGRHGHPADRCGAPGERRHESVQELRTDRIHLGH